MYSSEHCQNAHLMKRKKNIFLHEKLRYDKVLNKDSLLEFRLNVCQL